MGEQRRHRLLLTGGELSREPRLERLAVGALVGELQRYAQAGQQLFRWLATSAREHQEVACLLEASNHAWGKRRGFTHRL